MHPSRITALAGDTVDFSCFGGEVRSLEWLINGSLLETLNLNNVAVLGNGMLRLTNVPAEYSMTTIVCNDGLGGMSLQAVLLVQGNS